MDINLNIIYAFLIRCPKNATSNYGERNWMAEMALSGQSVETLMLLLEDKLQCVEIFDREDAREVKVLERCLDELQALTAKATTLRSTSKGRQGARSRPRARAR